MSKGCVPVKIGETSAIVCGGESDHVCNSDGIVLLLGTEPYEVPDTEENREKYKDNINGGSVSCTICGRSAFANSYREMW